MIGRPPVPAALRFWAKVNKTASCWLWTGHRDRDGYGTFRDVRHVRAHRWSWEQANGPIPRGLVLCHRCDTPSCVNPDHLFIGTIADNNRDMVAKGRQARGAATKPWARVRGEQHPHAVLNAEKVVAIRARLTRGDVASSVARDFGVTSQSVRLIGLRKSWRHIPWQG